MKIAIPVKMNNQNSAIAPLFGKAKWFALIENGQITIEANKEEGGSAVIEWLHQINVDTIIMQDVDFTTFFHPFHKKPSTFLTCKQAYKIVA